MHALLAGFFSTVGDTEALDVVRGWLDEEGVTYDVAAYSDPVRQALEALDPRDVEATRYTHLIVICGPYHRETYRRIGFDLDRFSSCVRIGVNLEIIDDDDSEQPFDVLLERGSSRMVRPDITFLRPVERLPVVGVVLAPAQDEYGGRQRHSLADDLVVDALAGMEVAPLRLDTRWPVSRNVSFIDSAEAYESVCSRVDAIVTTRLHGMVLALKNGVPVVAIDPIAGGDKVSRQAKQVHWPVLLAEAVTVDEVRSAVRGALTSECQKRARAAAIRATGELASLSESFLAALSVSPKGLPARTQPYPESPRFVRTLHGINARLRRAARALMGR